MVHNLKILTEYFEAILSGDKTFEVRSVIDREFHPGDELVLREWKPYKHSGFCTGREVRVKVTYVLGGIKYKDDPAVVMSIYVLKDRNNWIGDIKMEIKDV